MLTRTALSAVLTMAAALAAAAVAPHPAVAAAKTSLVLGHPVEPAGLDPTIAAPVAIREVTWVNLYEGLVRLDRDGHVQPLLAKSWTISPDGLVYTFKLQQGVTFHDGEPFSSATVKFAFDRARAPDSTNAQKQIFEPIDSIETPDPETAIVRLKHPFGNFLYFLTWGDAVMVSPKAVADNKTNPVGTGPFKFKQWVRGDRVELVRNPDYWQKDKVKLDSVTFRFIGDPQAQTAALRAGDIDAVPFFSAPELFGEFQKDPRFKAVVGATESKVVAGMNNARKPFDDIRVRRALMQAVDRKALIEAAYSGYGTPIGSHYSPNDPGYVDTSGVLPYDPAKAKAELAAAGYGNGLSFTIKAPQMAYASRSAELLAAMFADVGVDLKIVPTEFPAKWVDEVMKNTDYDMTIVAHAEPLDIGIYARDKYYFNYKNDKFKATMTEAERTVDDRKRAALYGDAQRMLAEDVPALYLFVLPKLGVWNAKLQGLWENAPIPSNDVTEVYWTE
ncbi:MAG TPA: ABC transporter substrate-binding protein [Stellaceae bacterium]